MTEQVDDVQALSSGVVDDVEETVGVGADAVLLGAIGPVQGEVIHDEDGLVEANLHLVIQIQLQSGHGSGVVRTPLLSHGRILDEVQTVVTVSGIHIAPAGQAVGLGGFLIVVTLSEDHVSCIQIAGEVFLQLLDTLLAGSGGVLQRIVTAKEQFVGGDTVFLHRFHNAVDVDGTVAGLIVGAGNEDGLILRSCDGQRYHARAEYHQYAQQYRQHFAKLFHSV